MILVLDIDGTLADTSHRNHFVEKKDPTDKDYQKFLSPEVVKKDKPIPVAQEVLNQLRTIVDDIVFLTGRPDNLRKVTVEWLDEHYGFVPTRNELFMRPSGSKIPAKTVKKSLLKRLKRIYKDELVFIDDEIDNLELFKEHGMVFEAPECWNAFKEMLEEPIEKTGALSVDTLSKIYEYSYKYGWLVSVLRQEGWLPERGYMLKNQIEDALPALLSKGLADLEEVYAQWLNVHSPEGWKAQLVNAPLDVIFSNFSFWHIPFWPQFLAAEIQDNIPPEDAAAHQDLLFALQLGAEDEKTMAAVIQAFGPVLQQRIGGSDFLDRMYTQYLKGFPELTERMGQINRAYGDLSAARGSKNLNEQIVAFQIGLNTAHTTGAMVDWAVDITPEMQEAGVTAKQVLDSLSAGGPNAEKWNKDLMAFLGIKILSKYNGISMWRFSAQYELVNPGHIVPLHEVRNKEKLRTLIEEMRKHVGWVGRPLLVEEYKDHYKAWTGSHRLEAAKEYELDEVPVLIIDPALLKKAFEERGIKEEDLPEQLGVRGGYVDITIDDEDRLEVLKLVGDKDALELMQLEMESNKSEWAKQWEKDSSLEKAAERISVVVASMEEVKKNLLFSDGTISVYSVNGAEVRKDIYIDFTTGGHDLRYKFIPENEIWLDDQQTEDEMAYNLLHEACERLLMSNGMEYEDAHDRASLLENFHRKHPKEIEHVITNLIKNQEIQKVA